MRQVLVGATVALTLAAFPVTSNMAAASQVAASPKAGPAINR
jgi:hypothetical protein